MQETPDHGCPHYPQKTWGSPQSSLAVLAPSASAEMSSRKALSRLIVALAVFGTVLVVAADGFAPAGTEPESAHNGGDAYSQSGVIDAEPGKKGHPGARHALEHDARFAV